MLSPRIKNCSWGKVEVEGFGSFKDAKLLPDAAVEWDWSVHGTRHDPGVSLSEVQDLMRYEVTAVVLSRGMHGVLQVPPETRLYLEERGIGVEVARTEQAVAMYNARAALGERVAALIHSTC